MFDFSEEHEMLQDMVKDLANEVLRPAARTVDAEEKIGSELMGSLAELDLFGLTVPEAYGGAEMDDFSLVLACEGMAKGCASTATALAHHVCLGVTPIVEAGSEDLKTRYLKELASGKVLTTMALPAQDPNDAASHPIEATADGDGWLLSGEGAVVTPAVGIGLILVPARTSDGALSLFAIPAEDVDSLDFPEGKVGLRGVPTAFLSLDGRKVGAEDLVGSAGAALPVVKAATSLLQITLAAVGVGIGAGAFEVALEYAKARKQFKVALACHQAVAHMLADAAAFVEGARWVTYRAATAKGAERVRLGAMARLRANEAAFVAADRAIQIHGGYGYSREFPPELCYRDAQALRLTATLPDGLRDAIATDYVP